MNVANLIAEVEAHVKQDFDPKNKRHVMRLNTKIKMHYEDRLRKLSLIEQVLKSEDRQDSLYNSTTHYLRARYND